MFAPAADAAAPNACFTQSPANPVVGQTVTFDSTCSSDPDPGGSIANRAWDLDNDGQFDDGTGVTATRTFATRGSFTVRLRVRDNTNSSDTESKVVTVNAAPTASFTNTPTAPDTDDLVTFNSTSTDVDGTIASYAWALDADGVFNDGTTASVSRTFTTPGNYTVKLRVTDNQGAESTSTRTITVANRPPTASIASNPASPTSGQSFTLTATASDPDGTVASYAWDVDGNGTDNFTAGSSTQTASFANPGTYPVKVRVTDNSGATTVATLNVTVGNRAPTAEFTFAPASPLSLEEVTWTSTSTDPDGTIASYAWDLDGDSKFNDGTGSTATRAFSTPGEKTVRLRVTDNSGAQSYVSHHLVVRNRPPLAHFTVSTIGPVAGDTITLTGGSADADGTITSETWDLDNDGQYDDATGRDTTFTAAAPGTYLLSLRVTDDKGVVHTVTKSVTFSAKPEPPKEDPPADPPADPQPTTPSDTTFDTSTPVTPTPPEEPVVPDQPSTVSPLVYLDPFPVVRMRGRATRKGAQLTLFTVRAPHGSLVDIRCKGAGCPARRLRAKIKTKRKRGSATVHFKRLERFLRAGTELEIAVTQKGMVGKYTRIRIRKLAVPVRSDRCLLPDSSKPTACPRTP